MTTPEIPAEPTNLSDVAFVDDSFWHQTGDGHWVDWDRRDVEASSWAVLVRWARLKGNRDPVVYVLAAEVRPATAPKRIQRKKGRQAS